MDRATQFICDDHHIALPGSVLCYYCTVVPGDAEAGVWYIADSDLPGLNLEGESLDELYDKLFHGIEEITGEPKVELELVVCWGGAGLPWSSPDRIEP